MCLPTGTFLNILFLFEPIRSPVHISLYMLFSTWRLAEVRRRATGPFPPPPPLLLKMDFQVAEDPPRWVFIEANDTLGINGKGEINYVLSGHLACGTKKPLTGHNGH